MGGEAADLEKKLYNSALTGDLITFQQLLQQDPNLLDRVSYVYCPNTITPLHIATRQGNKDIVEEVLKRNPQLAKLLDSQKSSPLHIAAAEGYVEIASMLLSAAPNMCWSRDCHGMNPIHIAAMNGQYHKILEELIRLDRFAAMEKVDRGQTVLHLCVKHGQLKALEVLVESLGELVWAEDDQGDTILHFAVRCNQIEMIRYLVNNNKIERSKVNSKGKTALDILQEIPPDRTTSTIKEILSTWSSKAPSKSLDKFREIGMVIAVLIAAMAFQAVVSPPGGVWQEDSITHRAGAAVMAYTHPNIYKQFVRANTVAFASSLIIIFLLTTRLSSVHVLLTVAVMHMMWVSLASIAVSYGAALTVIAPNTQTQSLTHVIMTVVAVTVSIIGLFWLRKGIRGGDNLWMTMNNMVAMSSQESVSNTAVGGKELTKVEEGTTAVRGEKWTKEKNWKKAVGGEELTNVEEGNTAVGGEELTKVKDGKKAVGGEELTKVEEWNTAVGGEELTKVEEGKKS